MTTNLPYRYRCSAGEHLVDSTHLLTICPVVVRGVACPGTLVRYGPGSRKDQRAQPASSTS